MNKEQDPVETPLREEALTGALPLVNPGQDKVAIQEALVGEPSGGPKENPHEPGENIAVLRDEPVPRSLRKLAAPMIAGMLAGSIYNIINAIFIGQSGDTNLLAALTLGLPAMIIVMAVGGLFGVGCSTLLSRLMGQENVEENVEGSTLPKESPEELKARISAVSSLSLWGPVIVGLFLGGLGIIFLDPMAQAFGASGGVLVPTKEYLGILIGGSAVLMAMFSVEQIIRGEGHAKASMYGMLVSTAANVVFDIVFILMLHMGVFGAGLSTVLANLVGLAYYVYFIKAGKNRKGRKASNLQLGLQHLSFRMDILKPVFTIGSSELVQSVFMLVTSLSMNFLAMSYGASLEAGIGAAQRVTQLSETITMGIFLGAMPMLAYCVGAGMLDRVRNTLRTATIWILGFTVIFSGLIFLFRGPVLDLIGGQDLVNGGEGFLTAMLVSTIFNGVAGLLVVWFQASGKAAPALVMTSLQGILAIPFMWGMNALWGQTGLVWSISACEGTMLVIGIILFLFTGGVAGKTKKGAHVRGSRKDRTKVQEGFSLEGATEEIPQ